MQMALRRPAPTAPTTPTTAPRPTPLLFPLPLPPELPPPELPPPEVLVLVLEAAGEVPGAVGVIAPVGAEEMHDAWALAAAAELEGMGLARVALPEKSHEAALREVSS